jgi:hypothetical protein
MSRDPVIPHTVCVPRNFVSIFHEKIIPNAARAPSKYVAIFQVHSAQILRVLLETK